MACVGWGGVSVSSVVLGSGQVEWDRQAGRRAGWQTATKSDGLKREQNLRADEHRAAACLAAVSTGANGFCGRQTRTLSPSHLAHGIQRQPWSGWSRRLVLILRPSASCYDRADLPQTRRTYDDGLRCVGRCGCDNEAAIDNDTCHHVYNKSYPVSDGQHHVGAHDDVVVVVVIAQVAVSCACARACCGHLTTRVHAREIILQHRTRLAHSV